MELSDSPDEIISSTLIQKEEKLKISELASCLTQETRKSANGSGQEEREWRGKRQTSDCIYPRRTWPGTELSAPVSHVEAPDPRGGRVREGGL